MSRAATLVRIATMGLCALALSGCISLLPKSKPVTLYRFGAYTPAEGAAPARPAAQVGVFKAGGMFQHEAAGDQLLTVTDGKLAYIAQTRWAAPASVLFDEAVVTAFDANTGPARLVQRGEPAGSKFAMRLDVRNFETRYDHGKDAAPLVLVRIRAIIVSATDHNKTSEQIFESQVRAGDNRVTAIVAAYNQGIGDVLGKLVAWTNAQAGA